MSPQTRRHRKTSRRVKTDRGHHTRRTYISKQRGGIGSVMTAKHHTTPTPKYHCNPNARKHKVTSNTCFTPKAIDLLKTVYNKQYPDRPIDSTDPRHILKEIRLKSSNQCKKDICLIKEFSENPRDQKMLKTLLFPPPLPQEWETDPDAWLSNYDIMDVLNQYENTYDHFVFIGPSAIDYDAIVGNNCVCPKLCSLNLQRFLDHVDTKSGIPIPKTKIGIVFNTDPHTKSGSHWVAMFIDLEDNFIFYFNSTGARIPDRIKKLVKKLIRMGKQLKPVSKKLTFHQNTYTEHQKTDTECGMYCLYFIITMLLREKEINYDHPERKQTKMTAKEVIQMFKGKTKEGRIMDKHVFDKRDEYFKREE